MNNTIAVNGVNLQINNPTCYNPDAIIGKYVVALGSSANAEFAVETTLGHTNQVAAQNLFVRAVRAVEYEENKEKLHKLVLCYSLYEGMTKSNNLVEFVVGCYFGYLFRTLFVEIGFAMFTSVTDNLGINVQYSI